MHRFNLLISAMILLCVAFSCQSHDIDENVPDDVLTLKVSKDTVVLNIADAEETAVTFSWSTGSNYGTGKAITYTFNMALEDKDYDEEGKVDFGKHQYSVSYTVEEFNSLVLKLSSLPSTDTEVRCKAIVTACVPEEEMLQTSEVSFVVKTYRPLPEQMCIRGTALAGEGNVEMMSLDNSVFVWQGNLNVGDISVYNDECGVVLSQSIDKDGRYTVMADMMKEQLSLNPVDTVYFLCEEDGWEFVPMEVRTAGVYSIVTEIKGGQFKFGTIPGLWHYMYVSATVDNAPWDSQDAIFKDYLTSEDDKKWFVWNSEEVPYEIVLDTRSEDEILTMKMTPYHTEISMIGDATSGGWSLDDRSRMDKVDVMVFQWTGTLNEGELKFCCGGSPEYGKGEWLMPIQDQTEFVSMDSAAIQMVDASAEDAKDYKWRVHRTGRYEITLNQYTLTLTVKEII